LNQMEKEMGTREMLESGVDLTLTSKLGLSVPNSRGGMMLLSPFLEVPMQVDPSRLSVPEHYYKPQASLRDIDFQKFPLETLFYIFYNYPEEKVQLSAVDELYRRGWRYAPGPQRWGKEHGPQC
jgi:CCR4-NOT transcription complex subunit 2